MIPGLENIENDITKKVKNELDRIGLLYRLFSRTKDRLSLEKKIERKGKYKIGGPKVQDIVGIRIVTYFKDDIEVVYSALKDKLNYIDETIDDLDLAVFKPKRNNIICGYNEEHTKMFNEVQEASNNEHLKLVDNTFELQLRTVLSEGWHEIDHSLRYKCREDWDDYPENERLLNGIYASLETNDQTLKNLFKELSYKHYKDQNWEGMLRTKFRLQFQNKGLDKKIINYLNDNLQIAKEIYKVDRIEILKKITKSKFSLPVNFNNLIYIVNKVELKDESITSLTPEIILDELEVNYI